MEYNKIAKKIDFELIKKFPIEILKENRIIPIEKKNGKIFLLSDETPPLPILDDLEVYSHLQIKLKLLSSNIITQLSNEFLEASHDTVEGMLNSFDADELEDYSDFDLDTRVENLEELAHEAPIIRLVNTIITNGLKKGASDIHIEPFEDELRLRYRIDGFLYEEPAPPRNLFPAIITRIKIMSNLNIAEKRLPQDGRIRIRVLGRELDIRVSIIPTLYGESVVLRLLDRAEVLLELKNLGFNNKTLSEYKELIKEPYGIVLVTGPTGSGKTTTLYATLNRLNSSDNKIVTIEDPVEYQLDGINQIQVKPEIDFSFASGLRSILRHDPDIIMVGEIRDLETAKIAIQAALTGHLVFATLHTNDAVGAITRFLEMGVEDYLLASSLIGVMAQRLVRVLCPECKREYTPEREEYEFDSQKRLFEANGCENCADIGFSGRTAIYELLPVNRELKQLITHHENINDIRDKASNIGMDTLYTNGWKKVEDGITTIDEVLRVTKNLEQGEL